MAILQASGFAFVCVLIFRQPNQIASLEGCQRLRGASLQNQWGRTTQTTWFQHVYVRCGTPGMLTISKTRSKLRAGCGNHSSTHTSAVPTRVQVGKALCHLRPRPLLLARFLFPALNHGLHLSSSDFCRRFAFWFPLCTKSGRDLARVCTGNGWGEKCLGCTPPCAALREVAQGWLRFTETVHSTGHSTRPGVGLIVSILCPVRRKPLVLELDSGSPVRKVCHFDTFPNPSWIVLSPSRHLLCGTLLFLRHSGNTSSLSLELAVWVENGDLFFFSPSCWVLISLQG